MLRNDLDGKTYGYRLFLQPSGALEADLRVTIGSLAKEYSGPLFDPHVTLLALIPAEEERLLIEKMKMLARTVTAFPVTLRGIGIEDVYFRALYSKVEPSDVLIQLHSETNRIFGMTDEEAYMPHLSFLYGNYPEERKAHTASLLGRYHGQSFLADRIVLYETNGEPKNWRKITDITMGS